jgi:hypothetical protein
MNDAILMVEILDYQTTPASLAARIWWSVERGLTCDNLQTADLLRANGIMIPPGRLAFPKDGRVFFDALPFGFSGLERAQNPVVVERQEGATL